MATTMIMVPLLRSAIVLCLIMTVMILIEKVYFETVSLVVKIFRLKPEKKYKWEPIRPDMELGTLAYLKVLLQIPMFNEKELLYHSFVDVRDFVKLCCISNCIWTHNLLITIFRDHIYGKDLPALTWKQRPENSIGAARGLHYLHTGGATGIIHRDVKTTNILLDENFVAKVSDFDFSKDGPGMGQNHVSAAVKDSFGYLDPEYFRRQQLTNKSDAYSFGVVLLKTLYARPALDPALPTEQVNLAEWAMKSKRNGSMEKIIDPKLVGTINIDSMNKYVEAPEKCLAEYGVDRPSYFIYPNHTISCI